MSVLVAGLLSILASTPCRTLPVEEREPLALVVLVPPGSPPHTPRSELYRVMTERARASSPFLPIALEQSAVDECRGALGCIAREARALPALPRLVVVVSLARVSERSDRAISLVVDAVEVERLLREERDRFEDAVFERAILTRTAAEELAGAAALVGWADDLLSALGRGGPPADVELTGAGAGAEVELDGQSVGESCAGVLRLTGVRAGTRRLRLRGRDGSVREEVLLVPATGRYAVEWRDEPDPRGWLRPGALYGGLTLVAAGSAVVLSAAVAAPSSTRHLCAGPADAGCGGAEFTRLGGTIPLAPLGLGLALAGATWLAGVVAADGAEPEWWVLAGGLVLGAGVVLAGAATGSSLP